MGIKVRFILFCFVFSITNFLSQSLSGRVLDEETNEAIPFAKISFPSIQVFSQTDVEGRFYIEQLPSSTLSINISAFDYQAIQRKVALTETNTITFYLTPQHTVFEEVVVSASEGRIQRENITAVEYRSKQQLFETGATTLGEGLLNIPGVQQNTIGVGISRPVIRGSSGMRVVTYWDGLRVENQQWGEDHGMATSELGMKGVEVVKGPSSLLYGADALGGVIHYIDEGYVGEGEQRFSASSKFETNSLGTTNELGYQRNDGKLKVNVFGNYVGHADFQLPNSKFIENSRFWAGNLKSAIGYRDGNYMFNLRYQATYSRLGIPGHTHSLNPTADEFISDRRSFREPISPAQYIQNHLLLVENKFFFKRSDLLVQLGNTNNHLREYDHGFDLPFTNLRLNNSTYNVRYHYHFNEDLALKTGVQGMYQMNRNIGEMESYLIPDANTMDNGAYALLDFDWNKWRFQAGARYDFRSIESFELDADSSVISNIDPEPINRFFQTLNYSAGLVRNDKRSTVRFNLSSGFRAPHLAELLASGVHHGSLRYEEGNRNLVAEQALQLDVALELHFDHLEVVINPFINKINNFIYLSMTDSVVSSNVGEFNYFEFTQVDEAFLFGGEIGFHYHPHQLHRLHLESNFSYVFGQDRGGNPLNLMPQPFLNSRVRFDVNNKNDFKLNHVTVEHQYFMDQNRVSPFERATPAYHLLNASASFSYEKWSGFNFMVGARNILNTEYIAHLSPLKNLGEGIAQPGINFFVKVRYRLDKKK